MTAQRPAAPQNGAGPSSSAFFIPDLCAAQAVFFAVLLAELVVLLHVLALGPIREFDWQALANASVFVQWNTLLSLGLLCWLRHFLNRRSPPLATALTLLIVVLVSVGSSLLAPLLYPHWAVDGALPWALRNALLALILAAIVLRYSYLQQRVALQQRSALQLRLDALQARIRPHFLFNTLNSIASLIAIDPPRAETAVEDVAELFRAALREPGGDSDFARERRLCELYLGIEQLRLGDRLQVAWDVAPGCDALPLPALTLQPLVENAVYHGIARLPAGGCIRIRGYQEGRYFHFSVVNPLPNQGERAQASSGNHMALDNIRQRLEARFGDSALLHTELAEGEFHVRLRVPVAAAGP